MKCPCPAAVREPAGAIDAVDDPASQKTSRLDTMAGERGQDGCRWSPDIIGPSVMVTSSMVSASAGGMAIDDCETATRAAAPKESDPANGTASKRAPADRQRHH